MSTCLFLSRKGIFMFSKKRDIESEVVSTPQPVVQQVLHTETPKMPDAFIGPHITVKGDIMYEGDFTVQGRILGNVMAVGDMESVLRIENGAEVIGNINVPVVKVDGYVKGEIESDSMLEISETGVVEGPVKYNRLAVQSGAVIEGQLTPASEPCESVGVSVGQTSDVEVSYENDLTV